MGQGAQGLDCQSRRALPAASGTDPGRRPGLPPGQWDLEKVGRTLSGVLHSEMWKPKGEHRRTGRVCAGHFFRPICPRPMLAQALSKTVV